MEKQRAAKAEGAANGETAAVDDAADAKKAKKKKKKKKSKR